MAALLIVVALLACTSPATSPGATNARPSAAASPASATTTAPAAASPQALERLRVPYVAISASQLPAWVAEDSGVFAKYGLDVSLEYIPTGTTLVQTMVAGEAAFGIAGSEAPISASLAGADIVILAPTVDHLLFTIYAVPSVTDPSAMRGKRLAITRVGSSTDFAARQWLDTLGLRAGDDVALIQAGGQKEILASMQSNGADAGVLSSPTDVEARHLGYREIADLGKLPKPFYQSSLLATRKLINERPDLVRRFVQAIVEADSIIHLDKAAATRALAKYAQITDDEVLEATYESAVAVVPKVPLPTRDAIESAIELVALTNPEARNVDPTRFFDPRFVQELQDSGFIDSLYK
ncbi:MAG TPA: ABC transporter substrate-binding protein [Chloroflexota bacterium]|nr:ABC transporter substrate-binding protein [Chloroflexota bacterium]